MLIIKFIQKFWKLSIDKQINCCNNDPHRNQCINRTNTELSSSIPLIDLSENDARQTEKSFVPLATVVGQSPIWQTKINLNALMTALKSKASEKLDAVTKSSPSEHEISPNDCQNLPTIQKIPSIAQPDSVKNQQNSISIQQSFINLQQSSIQSQQSFMNAQPNSNISQPNLKNTQPNSNNAQPNSSNALPSSINNQPYSVNNQPNSVSNQPNSANAPPSSINTHHNPRQTSLNHQQRSIDTQPSSVPTQTNPVNAHPNPVKARPNSINGQQNLVIARKRPVKPRRNLKPNSVQQNYQQSSKDLIWPLLKAHAVNDGSEFRIPQFKGPKVHLAKIPIARKKKVSSRQLQYLTKKFLSLAKIATSDLVGLLSGMLKQSGVMQEVLERCKIQQAIPVDPLKLRKLINLSNTSVQILIRELKLCRVKVLSNYWIEQQYKKIEKDCGSYEPVYIPLIGLIHE